MGIDLIVDISFLFTLAVFMAFRLFCFFLVPLSSLFLSFPFSYLVFKIGLEVIKRSCSIQLSIKFLLLIHVKMPTIVGILTCMSRKNSIIC